MEIQSPTALSTGRCNLGIGFFLKKKNYLGIFLCGLAPSGTQSGPHSRRAPFFAFARERGKELALLASGTSSLGPQDGVEALASFFVSRISPLIAPSTTLTCSRWLSRTLATTNLQSVLILDFEAGLVLVITALSVVRGAEVHLSLWHFPASPPLSTMDITATAADQFLRLCTPLFFTVGPVRPDVVQAKSHSI